MKSPTRRPSAARARRAAQAPAARSVRRARGPARGAARWRFAAPSQARAHASVERFAAAAERLLRDRPFEAIGVQQIARAAGRTTGAFYAHFSSKDALLPYLYARYDAQLDGIVRERLDRIRARRLGLEATVAAFVDHVVGIYEERRWFLRAMALFARNAPEAIPEDVYARRLRYHDLPLPLFAPHRARIAHPDPDEAVRTGVFIVSAAAREKLLFGDAPHARGTKLSRARLRASLGHVLHAWLTTPPPAGTRRI